MKIIKVLSLLIFTITVCCSCRNKTVVLLTKKWECVQVENIIPPDTRFLTPEDSVNAFQLQAMLQNLNWTFKNNMRYECAMGSRVTVQGKYELLENDKVLVCTPASKNISNSYHIIALTENELVLKALADNANLVLHFRPQ